MNLGERGIMDEKTKTKKEGVISHEKKTHVNLLYLKYICISCGEVHCKYIQPDYDGTLAIHISSTMIHCRDQLQHKIWKFLI